MICKNCGTENRDTAKFCMGCGAKLELPATPAPEEKSIFCATCGTQNSGTASFCKNCGTALKPQPGKMVETTIQNVKKKDFAKLFSSKKIIVAVIAVVVLVCGVVFYSCSQKDVVGMWYDTTRTPSETNSRNIELANDGSVYCDGDVGSYKVEDDTIVIYLDNDVFKLQWEEYDGISTIYYSKGRQYFTRSLEDAQTIHDRENEKNE